MTIAIMQPYFFPYIGYFQLIKAVDVFVFYDDVNYIKGGWINRNKILLNGKEHFFTIPCIKASQNRAINETEYNRHDKAFKKVIITIEHAYRKAPYFNEVFQIINKIYQTDTNSISTLAQQSIIQISKYLQLNVHFKNSSDSHKETFGMERAERIIEICKREKTDKYINALGGIELYDKSYFKDRGIKLNFIETDADIEYKQFANEFIPCLSIIDILMFNSVDETHKILDKYELI